jgi:bifunctional DNase/RNase
LTHDLMYSIISALTASVDFILLNDIQDDTYYAKIMLNVSGKNIEIDSRPSDAIALAVRAGTKIFAEETVLDTCGMVLDKETGKFVIPEDKREGVGGKKIGEEELKRLSAFCAFIDQTDLDNLGKNKQ